MTSCAQYPKEIDGRLVRTIRLLGHHSPGFESPLLTCIGVPLFAYFYEYSVLDWILPGFLYIVTGMGLTVGYHRSTFTINSL